MKVSCDIVIRFLNELNLLVEGINETVKSGDDGFEYSVETQTTDIRKAIIGFNQQYLTKLIPVKNKSLKYLKTYDDFIDRTFKERHIESGENLEISSQEHIDVYKARLYLFIKKELKNRGDISNIRNIELANWIEGDIICSSSFEKEYYSQAWLHTSFNVVQDIVNEITEERKKAPQLELF